MSIDFFCTRCESQLRAPDSKAGQAISCPYCSNRVWIPYETESFEQNSDSFNSLDDSDLHSAYEYDAPGELSSYQTAVYDETDSREREQRAFSEPQSVDLGQILSDSWSLYTEHWRTCMVVTVADAALTIIAFICCCFVGGFASVLAANRPVLVGFAFIGVVGLGMSVIMSMFAVGHIRFYLDLCRDLQPDVRKSMDFDGPVGSMLTGGLLYWTLFPLILPAIFLWPFGRVLIDQKSSASGAILKSLSLSGRHSGVSFAIFVVKAGALFVSGLIPVIGTLVVTPYLAILNTVTYLHFTGELE